MKTLTITILSLLLLSSCNVKTNADLTPADMRRAVQRAKIQQKIDSIEFANQMWVLKNNYQIAKKKYESSLNK